MLRDANGFLSSWRPHSFICSSLTASASLHLVFVYKHNPLFLDQIHLLHFCACDQETNLCQDPVEEGCWVKPWHLLPQDTPCLRLLPSVFRDVFFVSALHPYVHQSVFSISPLIHIGFCHKAVCRTVRHAVFCLRQMASQYSAWNGGPNFVCLSYALCGFSCWLQGNL